MVKFQEEDMKFNKKQKKVARIIKVILLFGFLMLIVGIGTLVFKHAGVI